jgi:hypothetical protein
MRKPTALRRSNRSVPFETRTRVISIQLRGIEAPDGATIYQ